MGVRHDIDFGVSVALYSVFILGAVCGIVMWEILWALFGFIKSII